MCLYSVVTGWRRTTGATNTRWQQKGMTYSCSFVRWHITWLPTLWLLLQLGVNHATSFMLRTLSDAYKSLCCSYNSFRAMTYCAWYLSASCFPSKLCKSPEAHATQMISTVALYARCIDKKMRTWQHVWSVTVKQLWHRPYRNTKQMCIPLAV